MTNFRPCYQYQEFYISSLDDIYETIQQYNSFYALPRNISNESEPELQAFYRGQSCSEWNIEPSLLRRADKKDELRIASDFGLYESTSLFSAISHIQHYHPGTRFIDFTLNPDIAIYFACKDNSNKDGALFIYSYAPYRPQWYSSIILFELARLNTNNSICIQEFSEILLKNHPCLKNHFSDIKDLNFLIASFLDHGFMVLPNDEDLRSNLRLQRQQGCFFVCGVEFDPPLTPCMRFKSQAGKNLFLPHSAIVPNSLLNGNGLVKLIIPKEIKPNIITNLENKGINEEYLMPQ